jgi:hypothetical protein
VSHFVIALIVFVCVFSSALLGLALHAVLPEQHVSDESSSVVKLAIGLVATMAAIVLGLLISSAKESFDTVSGDLQRNAAAVVNLDRMLAEYGPETQALRSLLKRDYADSVQTLVSGDPSRLAAMGSAEAIGRGEAFRRELNALAPHNDTQRELKASALQAVDAVFAARWLALLRARGSIPIALLVALVSWLCIIFGTFGLFSPTNGTIVGAFAMCALSAAVAIFLLEEMNAPLEGTVKVSFEPMRDALARLGE